ncbi:unnamed protein product [Gongylonema pulchrum]|uniref:CAF1C_H4-bd domain-containing protein n=1 Tax=Gongylonema pulchrum TaxID=637853 RepID=A0A183EKS2_9BILA|nr:unnamed protein product [Gongylonema pulchrum]
MAAAASEDNWELISKQQIIDEQNNSEDDEDYDDDDDDDWVHMYGHPYERLIGKHNSSIELDFVAVNNVKKNIPGKPAFSV